MMLGFVVTPSITPSRNQCKISRWFAESMKIFTQHPRHVLVEATTEVNALKNREQRLQESQPVAPRSVLSGTTQPASAPISGESRMPRLSCGQPATNARAHPPDPQGVSGRRTIASQ